MRKLGIVACALGLLLSINLYAGPTIGSTFNREAEFPNHFLPKNFATLPASQQKQILAERRRLLEKAMQSICDRLMVPVVPEGESIPRSVRYFEYVNNAAHAIDRTAEIMPSGGVVRSVIGYLYEKMHERSLLDPTRDPISALTEIISDSRPIDAIEVRGVGGDFDVLIKSDPSKFGALKQKIEDVTNSAENSLGARQDTTQAKRLLFTVGDVKSYNEQTKRSTSQGGSVVDYLAFDQHSGKFVEPEGHSYIVDELLQAKFRYIAPQGDQKAEDFAKQAVRGIRPLLELPFLELQNEAQFRSELQQLIRDVESGKEIGSKALEQIGKAVRNGRWSLGNNRSVRGQSGSIEALIGTLSKALKRRGLPYIPEYVDTNPIEARSALTKSELNGFPRELLTPTDEFIKTHTKGGVLYHGTPTLDNAMAIMRGGLYYSGGTYGQGGSSEGGGGYSATESAHAKGFQEGLQLRFKIKNDQRVNILIWDEKVAAHPFIREAQHKAAAMGLDLHLYLQRFHGIDFIQKGAMLIQNMGAIELGNNKTRLVNILESLHGEADDLRVNSLQRMNAAKEFSKLRGYSQALGLRVAPISDDTHAKILRDQVMDGPVPLEELLEYRQLLSPSDSKALAAFEPACLKAIQVTRDSGKLDAFIKLAQSGHESLRGHPVVREAFEAALVDAIRSAGDKGSAETLNQLAKSSREALSAFPKALAACEPAMMEALHIHGERSKIFEMGDLALISEANNSLPNPSSRIRSIIQSTIVRKIREDANHTQSSQWATLSNVNYFQVQFGQDMLAAIDDEAIKIVNALPEPRRSEAIDNLTQAWRNHGFPKLGSYAQAELTRRPKAEKGSWVDKICNRVRMKDHEFRLNAEEITLLKAHHDSLKKVIDTAKEIGVIQPLMYMHDKHPDLVEVIPNFESELVQCIRNTNGNDFLGMNWVPRSNVLNRYPRALEAYILEASSHPKTVRELVSLATQHSELLDGHQQAGIELGKALRKSIPQLSSFYDLESASGYLKNLEIFLPDASAVVRDATLALIHQNANEGEVLELFKLVNDNKELLVRYPELQAQLEPAIVKGFAAAADQGNVFAFTMKHEKLEAFPEAQKVYEKNLARAVQVAGEKGYIDKLRPLHYSYGGGGFHEWHGMSFSNYPEAYAQLEPAELKALAVIAESGDAEKLWDILPNRALKAHPDLKAKAEDSLIKSIRSLAAQKKNAELVELSGSFLGTFQNSLYKEYPNVLVELIRYGDEKTRLRISNLFHEDTAFAKTFFDTYLMAPSGRRALVAAAQSGDIYFINQQIGRARDRLPVEVREALGTSGNTRAVRKAVSSGTTTRSCGELLRLLSIKYQR